MIRFWEFMAQRAPPLLSCVVRRQEGRMGRGRFKMIRVPVPEWAPTYARGTPKFVMVADKYYGAMSTAERDALIQLHADILTRTDAAVEEYANEGCAPPGEDWFPEQIRLTGEYYIGGESYSRRPGGQSITIRIHARCIGRDPGGPGDYLGLDVWFDFDPDRGRLSDRHQVDSQVI